MNGNGSVPCQILWTLTSDYVRLYELFESYRDHFRWPLDLTFMASFHFRESFEYEVFGFQFKSTGRRHVYFMTVDWFIFKFLRSSVNGKHLIRFQSEHAFFKFLRINASM